MHDTPVYSYKLLRATGLDEIDICLSLVSTMRSGAVHFRDHCNCYFCIKMTETVPPWQIVSVAPINQFQTILFLVIFPYWRAEPTVQ